MGPCLEDQSPLSCCCRGMLSGTLKEGISMMNEEDKDERFYRDTESIAFVKLDDRQ